MHQVVILAGGYATRLKELTSKTPKSLININGSPFLKLQIQLLKSHGVTNLLMCIGHLGDKIIDYIESQNNFEMSIEFSNDGNKPLGTAGSIRKALPKLEESFFVLYGDSYLTINYNLISKYYMNYKLSNLMTITKKIKNGLNANVKMEGNNLREYSKSSFKEDFNFIDYGLSLYKAETFELLPKDEHIDLESVVKKLIYEDNLKAFETEDEYFEIGSYDGIEELSSYLKERS